MESFMNNIKNYQEEASPAVWGKLSDRLDHSKTKSKLKIYRWLAVASICGFLCLSMIYLHDNTHFAWKEGLVSTHKYRSTIVEGFDYQETTGSFISQHSVSEMYAAYENKRGLIRVNEVN